MAAALAARSRVPLAVGSPAGAALGTAGACAERFGLRAEQVLDAGPARVAEHPAVLSLAAPRLDLVRPGVYDAAALRRAAGLRLCFVCTGNTCRSPMAHEAARALLASRLEVPPDRVGEFGFELTSAGTFASPGQEASPLACEVLAEIGLDGSSHRARAMEADVLLRSDRIYCMASSHREAVLAALGAGPAGADAAERVALLDPTGANVLDPVGGTIEDYRDSLRHIQRCLAARALDWA